MVSWSYGWVNGTVSATSAYETAWTSHSGYSCPGQAPLACPSLCLRGYYAFWIVSLINHVEQIRYSGIYPGIWSNSATATTKK